MWSEEFSNINTENLLKTVLNQKIQNEEVNYFYKKMKFFNKFYVKFIRAWYVIFINEYNQEQDR